MKILKVFSLPLILMLVGCGKEKVIVCNTDINNNVQNYKTTGVYKIYYNDNYVTKIEKNEKYTSDDNSMIEYFYESKSLEYFDLSDKYGGVTYNIEKLKDEIDIKSNIDLKEFDLNRLSKDGKIDKDYIINGRLTLNGLKRIYKSKGIVCE